MVSFPDASLELLGRWLGTRGYRTHRSRIGLNAGCSEAQCERLEKRLEQLAADSKLGPDARVG